MAKLQEARKNMASAGQQSRPNPNGANGNLNDSLLQGGGTIGDNAEALDPNVGLSQKFDPSKYISEDFLQILNEHRKVCEREGKL